MSRCSFRSPVANADGETEVRGCADVMTSARLVISWCCLLFLLVLQCRGRVLPRQEPICGYGSCPTGDPTKLNVHIICHTHLDAGWVQTLDTYYSTVTEILDSVTNELFTNPDRKFIMVETVFFSRWWKEKDVYMKRRIRRLIENGQLEFISGGWTMNDEATTHYTAIIDQMTLGLRWLNNTFGQCGIPKTGWQIDPFGHSKQFASLLAQMSYDGLFLGRIDYQDKEARESSRQMEFVWKASPNIRGKGDIFTGILPNVYWPPRGFCFEFGCYDDDITEENKEDRAVEFIELARIQANHYATNHIVMTMGMDFFYRDASRWYVNLDMLMNQVNSMTKGNVSVFYSTPSCYLQALYQANRLWPIKDDDFFPYADQQHAYWTGYFTSRPTLKYYVRHANIMLQACKQLVALSRLSEGAFDKLQEAMGVLQHHDAVTGTAKEFVVEDYRIMLFEGIVQCQATMNAAYKALFTSDSLVPGDQVFCEKLNMSECHVTENGKFIITVYNPRGQSVDTHIRVPVRLGSYIVKDAVGALVDKQLVPILTAVTKIPERGTTVGHEVVFPAHLPALGFTTFQVEAMNDYTPTAAETAGVYTRGGDDVIIGNENIKVIVDSVTGLMREVLLKDGQVVPLHQSFYYYEGQPAFEIEKASGAYAFNPIVDEPFHLGNNVTISVVRGPLVEEVHQTFNSWVSQVIRIYKDSEFVEFDWVVGPIPVREDYKGKEVISRFDSFLMSNYTFYTDSNGREIVRRVRNFRPTWDLNVNERVAGNYYPVASTIFIRDPERNLQLTLLTDRSEGGSSVRDGSLELMVHRRLIFDDGYGMEEALDEIDVDDKGLMVRGKHILMLTTIQESARKWKEMSRNLFWKPILTFRSMPSENYMDPLRTQLLSVKFSGLKDGLPSNINILTLEPICTPTCGDKILLRLEHCFEINEDAELSMPTTLSLKDLFRPFKIVAMEETNLSANQYARDVNRLKFRSVRDYAPQVEDNRGNLDNSAEDDFVIVLKAMEIKTFIITVQERSDCAPEYS